MATVASLFLLLVSVPNVGPAIRAARADGTPGTFTAGHATCVNHLSHEACSWYGTFRPAAGGHERADLTLYGAGKNSLRTGERVAAVDTGRARRVYRPSGSHEWIVTGILLLAGIALLAPLGSRVVSGIRPGGRRPVGSVGQDDRREGKTAGRSTRST